MVACRRRRGLPDALLVSTDTGEILQVEYDVFG